jgi:hypothetical protein
MIIRDNGNIKSNYESMPPLEDNDGDELALLVDESLVIRRTLQVLYNAMYKARCGV